MKKTYSVLTKNANLYYSAKEFLFNNKLKIIIICICCIVGLLTGIFTAIKISAVDEFDMFEAFNLTKSLEEFEKYSEYFFNRLLSCEIVLLILFAFAQHFSIFVFGIGLLACRAFLVAVNCTMIIVFFHVGGILKSLIIILPCQILMLCVMVLFFTMCSNQACERKNYAKHKMQGIGLIFLIASLSLALINLVETLLLFLFKSSVILVI